MNFDYRLFVPKQAVGADLVYFDLFNNHDESLILKYVEPVVSGAVAVTGVVGLDLLLTYTSAIGTGGTAATYDGTDTTAMTFTRSNPAGAKVPLTITARITPTGGATAGGVVCWTSVFSEETNAGTYTPHILMNNQDIIIPKGYGIRVVQGAVASVGNIGFNVGFSLAK